MTNPHELPDRIQPIKDAIERGENLAKVVADAEVLLALDFTTLDRDFVNGIVQEHFIDD